MNVESVKQSHPRIAKEDYQTIFQMYSDRVPITHIAHQFKVSRPTIYNIVEKVQKDQKKIDFYFEKIMKIKL